MIQGRVLVGAHGGLDRASLRFSRPVYDPCDPGVDHRPHTHLARLDGNVERRAGQPVIRQTCRRLPQRDDFGVGGRIVAADRLVEPGSHDRRAEDDDSADRDLTTFAGLDRLVERRPHETLVRIHEAPFPLNHPVRSGQHTILACVKKPRQHTPATLEPLSRRTSTSDAAVLVQL